MPNEEVLFLENELDRLRQEPPGSELAAVLNELAYATLHSNPHRSEAFALEAMDLAENLGLPVEQANSLKRLGTINYEAGKVAEAMSYCRGALEIYEKLEDKKGIASILSTMASTYWSQGIIDKALEYYHESLNLRQECGAGENDIAQCHVNIGACYNILHRHDLAQASYEFARDIWEKSGDRMRLSYVYNNIGCVYQNKNELNQAREYYEKALEIWMDLGDKMGIANVLGNLGSLRGSLDDKESALDLYLNSLEYFEEIGNMRGVAHTCGCIGEIYSSLGSFQEAETFLMRGLSITRELNIKDTEIDCLRNTRDMFELKGDCEQALQYSEELKVCVEKYLDDKSMDKIAVLQVQFETEKKEKEAEIYRLRNVELSEMNDQLRDALAHVKRLKGLLPICSHCKKIRDDDGYWKKIDLYLSDHSDAKFSHGICPECFTKLYGKVYTKKRK